jgi:hypothetical protein
MSYERSRDVRRREAESDRAQPGAQTRMRGRTRTRNRRRCQTALVEREIMLASVKDTTAGILLWA